MANYPNYYPNNQMNGYQPMYGQQYQNFQPPYQQNMPQTQPQMQVPQQQPQQTSGMNALVVDDFSLLSANDVPMDGSGAVFIKRDGSEIQWRRWGNMGNIEMTSYKPILEQNNKEGTNIPKMDLNMLYEDVKSLREEISERFDRLEKSMTGPSIKSSARSSNSRTKKEADAE